MTQQIFNKTHWIEGKKVLQFLGTDFPYRGSQGHKQFATLPYRWRQNNFELEGETFWPHIKILLEPTSESSWFRNWKPGYLEGWSLMSFIINPLAFLREAWTHQIGWIFWLFPKRGEGSVSIQKFNWQLFLYIFGGYFRSKKKMAILLGIFQTFG